MTDNDRIIIKELMSGMHCSKNFECAKNDYKNLCKVKAISGTNIVECESACNIDPPLA